MYELRRCWWAGAEGRGMVMRRGVAGAGVVGGSVLALADAGCAK